MALALASALLSEAGFAHGFTTRAAGDFAVGRDLAPAGALLAKQVHSARVHRVTKDDAAESLATLEVDALLAPAAGPTVGIRVADCVPVLVVDPEAGEAAAVHAGWRGVAGGIVEETLKAMTPGASARVLVALGPSIGSCCYEVGTDVAEQLLTPGPLIAPREDTPKIRVDLRHALELQLLRLGVEATRIERVGGCSRCESSRFHSYRRDGVGSGRMVGWVSPR